MPLFFGRTSCDLQVPYKLDPNPWKQHQNWLAVERWATYLTRNCLPASGLPQGWCGVEDAAPDGSDPWGGAILTIAANTIDTTAPMLAIDIVVDVAITTAATYAIDFSWTNSGDGNTVAGFSWRDVVSDVDGGTISRRLPWHCLMETQNLDHDWEFRAVVYGSNAVALNTHWKVVEVTRGSDQACCAWFTPT